MQKWLDLDIVEEPMIADPDVNNADVSKKDIDTIRPLSFMVELKKLI
jgi:aconitate hydratase 2/2-methylisocitrate dehydratase